MAGPPEWFSLACIVFRFSLSVVRPKSGDFSEGGIRHSSLLLPDEASIRFKLDS